METDSPEARPLVNGTRRCSRCRKTKPLEQFVKQRREKFGRGYHCKRCAADRVNAYHRRRRAEARAGGAA